MWLGGELQGIPADWSFTDAHREVALQVGTPYLLPHSVTIFCAADGASLYIGASDPERKNWPGWVDADPDVQLKIGANRYRLRARPLADETELVHVRLLFAAKYGGPARPVEGAPPVRFWQLVGR
jgi:hypothetical protein